MKKPVKIIIAVIVSFIIVYFGRIEYRFIRYSHSSEFNNYKRYLWLFNDSVKCNIDTFICVGDIGDRDILYRYLYKKKTFIRIWEFKDISESDLKKIQINQNIDLDDVKFKSGEIVDKNMLPSPMINMKLEFSFNNSLIINLDKNSKISKTIDSTKYRGFYGNLSKMTFNNEKNEPLILFDFGYPPVPTLLLLYRTTKSFYVIYINSDLPFDESLIKILNLK